MEATTLIIAAVLIVLVKIWLSSGPKMRIPGPWTNGLPIVGSLPFMTSRPFIKLTEMGKKFGPVYRLKLGGVNVVVLTDFETIKEAFSKDALMGRPPDIPLEFTEETLKSEVMSTMKWIDQRRFSLHMLRDLGFGKTRMEEHIQEEILELLQLISEYNGKPVKHAYLLAPSMSNNIASLLFGKRLKYNDPQRQRLDTLVRDVGRLLGMVSWQLFFPWIREIFKKLNIGSHKQLASVFLEMREYCRKEMEEHEATLDPNNIRDFIDGYLLEIEKKKTDPNTTFKKDILIDVARGFFGAGSETVRVTVDWLLLVCAAFPLVQKRIQAEIDEVVGQERFPTWQDRLNMPFTEASIAELMRWRSIIPLNLMRYTLEDTEIKGYFIPKHTNVLAVLWAVDHDTRLWGNDADEYTPERFLREDGRKFVKPDFAIPFSYGKRACPGKSLAEIEVFLYLVAILQKFDVQALPGQKIDLDGELGISLQPKKQELCFKLRQ
ncbi:Cytochrome P450 18a1 like protein [Argiope bruennichi]|nr:Cytochrome P450 18a1 like protein [Argiope bruennichi]